MKTIDSRLIRPFLLQTIATSCLSINAATNSIVPGVTQTGTITNGSVDAYEFSATQGEKLTIYMANTGFNNTFFPTVVLRGPNGAVLAQATNNLAALLSAVPVTDSGMCVLFCRNRSAQGGGSYGVTVVKHPGPNGFELGETNSITPGLPVVGTNTTGDLDVYEFSANAGERVTIFMQELGFNSGFEPTFTLVGPNGASIAEATDNDSALLRSVLLSSDGDYSIICRDSGGGLAEGGTVGYGVSVVKHQGPNQLETGETNRIAHGVPVFGTNSLGDLDAYEFTASWGDRVMVTMRETSFNSGYAPTVAVYSPNGGFLGEATSSRNAILQLECLPYDGSYFIICRDDNGGRSGRYMLSLEHVSRTPTADSPPELQVIPCFSVPVVRWSTNATGFRLQYAEAVNASPAATVWNDVQPPYHPFTVFYCVTNSVSPEAKFFRLIKP